MQRDHRTLLQTLQRFWARTLHREPQRPLQSTMEIHPLQALFGQGSLDKHDEMLREHVVLTDDFCQLMLRLKVDKTIVGNVRKMFEACERVGYLRGMAVATKMLEDEHQKRIQVNSNH